MPMYDIGASAGWAVWLFTSTSIAASGGCSALVDGVADDSVPFGGAGAAVSDGAGSGGSDASPVETGRGGGAPTSGSGASSTGPGSSSSGSASSGGGASSSGAGSGGSPDAGGGAPGPTCSDGWMNGSETDVDCGGLCPACAAGWGCDHDDDCVTDRCHQQLCVECIQSQHCGMNAYCDGIFCQPRQPVGGPCANNDQCLNGPCDEGTCEGDDDDDD